MKKLLLMVAILLWSGLQLAMAQSRPVKGQVLDEKGEGVPGASVQIKGATSGTVTDIDGNFSLDVPDDKSTLVITAIGYAPQEVNAGDGDNAINIKLSSSGKLLGETVVTALNVKKEKRSLGYSVSEVGSDAIEASGERNPIEALAAKAPGIQVTSSGGTPGASSKILLRGNASFTGNNSPLIIVDGIIIDNTTTQPVAGDYPYNVNLTGVNESNRALDLNPDDIESVSVLKGPAAATLYGANGANGAIMITTKKGKYGKGQGLGITYNSSVEVNKVSRLPAVQKEYGQGAPGTGGLFNANTPYSWGPKIGTDPNVPTAFDNYGNFFKTGVGFNNTLAVNGGNDVAIFRISVGNYNTRGMVPNTMLDRTTANMSGEAKLSSWLTVGGSANYTYSEARMVQNGSNVAGPMLSLFRAPSSYDLTKNYYDPTTGATSNYYAAYDNPFFSSYRNPYNTFTNRLIGKAYFNATITKDLTLSYNFSTDNYSNQTRQIYDIGSVGNDLSDGTGQLNKSQTDFMHLYSDAILRYNKKVGDLGIGVMGGYNYQYEESRSEFMRGYPFVLPNLYNFSNTSTYFISNVDGYTRTQAVFGEIALNYKSFLYLTMTGRKEWLSAYSNKGFFYPHVDASWVFSEQIPKNDVLTYGKLRAAYADAANGPRPYSNRPYYYVQPFLTDGWGNGNGFPYNGMQGFMPNNIINGSGLKPEHVVGKEIGAEFRFWKDRITFEATYYNQKSKDVLLDIPIAPSTGFQYEYANAGELVNKGLELALNIDVVKTKDITVNIGANWSKNTSKVTKLANGVSEVSIEPGFTQIGSYAIVGQPYGVFYGSDWEKNAAGQLLIGANGEPIVNSTSTNLGNPNPDWLMGLNGNFSYKGFTFSMLWDIRHGGKIWNGTWARMNNVGIADQTADRDHTFVIPGVYDAGTPNAGQANNTAVSAERYWRYYQGDLGAASNAIQDGGWVRLRSIALSYRFKFNHTDHPGNPFKYAEIGFTGRNLILSTKYKGVDPETSLTGAGSNIGGWDYFNNPGSKAYIFNLRFGL
jgi:TonB-linked SusC/RagA family outer membrane protein